jgi:hypothetical protein
MVLVDGLLMMAAAGLITLAIVSGVRRNEQERRLRDAFYALLETQDSCLSLIQLAATARTDAARTKEFLETQAEVFSATLEIDADSNLFYRFPKVQQQAALPAVLEDEWTQ